MLSKVNKSFISDVDQFLERTRRQVPETDSQRAEREKYQRINKLRDHEVDPSADNAIWEDF